MGDRWTVTTATEHSGYPASNLLRDNLARYWRAWNNRESGTWVSAVSDTSSQARTISTVSMLGLNRVPPTDSGNGFPGNFWRVRIDSYPLADRIRPAFSISNLVNLTGSSPDVSGPLDPPIDPTPSGYSPTRLEASNNALGTSLRVTFTNHHATERPLDPTGTQLIRVYAADSVDPAIFPQITATIVPSSGSSFSIIPIAGQAERVADGYILNLYWDTSSLTVPTATVRLDLAGASTGTSTVEFLGIEWVAEISDLLYDSAPGGTSVEISGGENARVLPDVEIPAYAQRYVFVSFSDFTVSQPANGAFPGYPLATDPGGIWDIYDFITSNGQFHAGRFVAADTFELQTTNDGWLYAPQSNGDAQPMRDGSERFPSTVMSWDEYEIKAESRTESQAVDDLLLGLYRAVDVRFPFLVIPHEDEPSHDRWVRFVPNTFELSGGGVKAGKEGMGRRWNFEARVKEHTARAGVRG